MSDFPDVERFGREHAGCGGIARAAAPQAGGGFVLTLTCACGATLSRMISPDQAKRPLPRPPASPSADLEAALRAAVEAEEVATAPAARPAAESKPAAPPIAPPSAPRPAVMPPGRTSPAKLNLDTTIRTAITQQAALTTAAARRRAAPRTRVVWLVLFAVLGLGVAATIYVVGNADAPPATTAAPASAPAPPVDTQQRAALGEILESLRQLQTASSPNTSLSVYSSRVAFAKSDVDRFIGSTAAGAARTGVREVMDIHLLAAAAWRARTLGQRDLYEAVGQDPAVDLCPSVKRVLDFAAPPENGTRAQGRGMTVASSVPLLWECAGQKLAALEQAPR